MSYTSFQVPEIFLVPPNQMDMNIANAYYEWFNNLIEVRILYLKSFFFASTKKELDFSASSLIMLYDWFVEETKENFTTSRIFYEPYKEALNFNPHITMSVNEWYDNTIEKSFLHLNQQARHELKTSILENLQKIHGFGPDSIITLDDGMVNYDPESGKLQSFIHLLSCRLEVFDVNGKAKLWYGNYKKHIILFDISLYILQVLKKNHPKLLWCNRLKNGEMIPVLTNFKYQIYYDPFYVYHYLDRREFLNTYNEWMQLTNENTNDMPLGPYYTWEEQVDFIKKIGFPNAFTYLDSLIDWSKYDPNDWGVVRVAEFIIENKDIILQQYPDLYRDLLYIENRFGK